ncbi:MAG TPA: glycosyltransferase family 39 protein [bacterium]|nr:glycosyltransferase family 39 protein [bacterium]
MSKSPSASPLPFHPWIYFFIFLTANTLLSYFTFSTETNLWIGFLGLALPFGLAWWTNRSSPDSNTPLYQIEFFKKIPLWVWLLIGAGAVFFRFYKLTTLSAWPIYDEGMVSFCALQIAQKGVHHLFYMFSQIPFFYLWVLGSAFKLFGPSLFNLWFWPAVISALWVPLAYLTARQYFSKSFSFFCVLTAGLSFWPSYLGRFSVNENLLLPLETLALLWLALCLRAESKRKQNAFSFILGLTLGLSLYVVFLHWISVLLMMSFTAGYFFWKRRPSLLVYLGGGLALPLVPFLALLLNSDGTSYFHTLSAASLSEPWFAKLKEAWNTPKGLFWGVAPQELCYKPLWGGLINPVLGALFAIGLLENLKTSWGRWLCVSAFILLIPGMLIHDFEFYRVLPALVVLIPIIALGWARLTRDFSRRWAAVILLGLMSFSVALDFYQLFQVYPHLWDSPAYWLKESKAINDYRAYQLLKTKSQTDGPGLIFSNFIPGFNDQNLNLADYGFNAAANLKLDSGKAQWAALVVNVNYQPFLAKHLGAGKTYWLSKDLSTPDGGLMLWVAPINESNRSVFNRWREADSALNGYLNEYFEHLDFKENNSYSKILAALDQTYPYFKNDPFLEACYWEKRADLFSRVNLFTEADENLTRAVQKGYPAAHLFYHLGTIQMITQNNLSAEKNFHKAALAPINFTQSVALLNQLTGKANASF